MPNCIKSCHDCEQNLRRAYVGRSPLTTDMLFTCLKCKAIGLSALRIQADANKTPRDSTLMFCLGGKEGGVRATKTKGNSKTLRRAKHDIGTKCPGRFEYTER